MKRIIPLPINCFKLYLDGDGRILFQIESEYFFLKAMLFLRLLLLAIIAKLSSAVHVILNVAVSLRATEFAVERVGKDAAKFTLAEKNCSNDGQNCI